MNAEKARAIIAQALEDEATEGPMPEDDEKAIAKATELVELAREAWEGGVKGREVENILNLADSDVGGDEQTSNGNGATSEDDAPRGVDEPFEGYGSLSAAYVKEALSGLMEDEEMSDEDKLAILQMTHDYESVTKTRTGVMNAIDAARATIEGSTGDAGDPDPEPEGEPQAAGDPDEDELTSTEPWDGYNDMSVKEVTEGLDLCADEYDEDDLRAVLTHVYAYESANRASVRIIKKVEDIGQQKGFIEGDDETGGGEDAAASAPDAGHEGEAEGGEGDGEEAGSPDDGEPDAGADEGAEAPEPDAEGASDDAEAAPAARRERSADGGDGFEVAYRDLIAGVKEQIDSERLHVPAKITEDAPELPFDLTVLDNVQVQKLHSAFTAFAYRIGYLRMLEEGYAKAAKQAADELVDKLLAVYEAEKGETVTSIKAKLDQDPNVMRLRRAQHKHEAFSSSYKMQQENYNSLLDRISRFWSMRREEWEMSGNKIGKAPTRSK